jgi:hypothetical protein
MYYLSHTLAHLGICTLAQECKIKFPHIQYSRYSNKSHMLFFNQIAFGQIRVQLQLILNCLRVTQLDGEALHPQLYHLHSPPPHLIPKYLWGAYCSYSNVEIDY